ncbi:MAG: DinB family protein [Gemmatimonadales bacterium]
MVPRQPWFERRFSFDYPVSASAGVVERLRGTPARLVERLKGLAPAQLTQRRGDQWSIQENVGHLWDLEPLWLARIEDIAVGRLTLQEADLENRRTWEAHHNDRLLSDLLTGFETARRLLVRQLDDADDADWLRSARHPRLQVSMRLVDLAIFVAEHDDHHLATITENLRGRL